MAEGSLSSLGKVLPTSSVLLFSWSDWLCLLELATLGLAFGRLTHYWLSLVTELFPVYLIGQSVSSNDGTFRG